MRWIHSWQTLNIDKNHPPPSLYKLFRTNCDSLISVRQWRRTSFEDTLKFLTLSIQYALFGINQFGVFWFLLNFSFQWYTSLDILLFIFLLQSFSRYYQHFLQFGTFININLTILLYQLLTWFCINRHKFERLTSVIPPPALPYVLDKQINPLFHQNFNF